MEKGYETLFDNARKEQTAQDSYVGILSESGQIHEIITD